MKDSGKAYRARVAARMEEMRTDPIYRPILVQAAFSFALVRRRDRFATEAGYAGARTYLVEELLPRFLSTGEPYNVDVCLPLAVMAIEGLAAADRLKALA